MNTKNHTLPNDIQALQTLVIEKDRELEKYKQKNEDLEIDRENLASKVSYLQKLLFGRKSEKLTPEDIHQGRLFNEAETYVNESNDTQEYDEQVNETGDDKDTAVVKSYSRKKKGRKPIPDDIPRVKKVHDLTEEEKRCACCGEPRPLISEDVREELEIIPAKLFVRQNIHLTYGPCKCKDSIENLEPGAITAPGPKRMLPGSIAGVGLLSYVLTSKFCDAIPFYRQSKIFTRANIDISRATMCNWMMTASEKMDILFDVMKETLKSGEFIRMDETTVQVLNEENRNAGSKSYMWVATGYPARGHPLVMYEYHPTRAGHVPLEFLKGYKGYLQTDGYAGYNASVAEHDLVHVGCMAHARREFHKAYNPKHKKSYAYKALRYIQKIYDIETDLRAKNLPDDLFVEKRREVVTPLLDEFHAFLVEAKDVLVPSSLAAKAVNYTLNEWKKLIRYLDLACITPDNNEIERSVKSFVIGRKNWLFSNTPRGANASARMFSLIESAKANKLNPHNYLYYLFTKLPYVCDNRDELKKLLPCFLSEEDIKISD